MSVKKRSQSQNFNRFLDIYESWLNEEIEHSEFIEAIAQKEVEAESAVVSFQNQIETYPSDFITLYEGQLQGVLDRFETHQEQLRELSELVQSGHVNEARELYDPIVEHFEAMLEVMKTVTGNFYAFGDSSIPVVNLIKNIARQVKENILPTDMLGNVLKAAKEFFLEQAEVESDLASKEINEERRAEVYKMLQWFDEINFDVLTLEGLEQIEARLSSLESAAQNVFSVESKVIEINFLQTPTDMPTLNFTINVLYTYLAGSNQFSSVMIQEAMDNYEGTLQLFLQQAQPVLEDSHYESITVEEFTPVFVAAVEAHVDAWEQVKQAWLKQDKNALESSLQQLIISAEEMEEAEQNLAQANLEAETIVCMHCGYRNQQGSSKCGQCGAVLPIPFSGDSTTNFEIGEFTQSQSENSPVITENLVWLMESAYAFTEERLSEDDFHTVLNTMRKKCQQGIADYSGMAGASFELKPEPDWTEEEQDEFARLTRELEDLRQDAEKACEEILYGLDIWEDYIQSRKDSDLVAGGRLIWEGFKVLGEVLRLENKMRLLAENQATE